MIFYEILYVSAKERAGADCAGTSMTQKKQKLTKGCNFHVLNTQSRDTGAFG
jgi:hypothetical protein